MIIIHAEDFALFLRLEVVGISSTSTIEKELALVKVVVVVKPWLTSAAWTLHFWKMANYFLPISS